MELTLGLRLRGRFICRCKSSLRGSHRLQATSQKETKDPSLQLAAAREITKPVRREAIAIDRKRKPATPNPEKH